MGLTTLPFLPYYCADVIPTLVEHRHKSCVEGRLTIVDMMKQQMHQKMDLFYCSCPIGDNVKNSEFIQRRKNTCK